MRRTGFFAYVENIDADQLCGNRAQQEFGVILLVQNRNFFIISNFSLIHEK